MTLSRYIIALLAAFAFALTSCLDDRLYNPDDYDIGDGLCDLPVTVSFRDLEPALESRSAGNAVNEVSSLWVVIYSVVDGKPTFYKKIEASSLEGYKCDQTGNSAEPDDVETGDNLGPTGEKTPHAEFTLKNIPFGRYQIYAVANLDLNNVDLESEGHDTPEYLKSRTVEWQNLNNNPQTPDFSKINQMFGYFTPANDQKSQGFEAPTLILNKETVEIHAWIKRLVSKVTIAYDASELKEAVRVYIKSVTIRDIPKRCYLGENNTPSSESDTIKTGEQIRYYKEGEGSNADRTKWLTLSRGNENKTGGEVNHSETDRALYFFENMQNANKQDGVNYDKAQQAVGDDKVGKPIDKPEDGPDYKDKLEYGTYIEVEGYYESWNKENLTEGPIKYRFMLGKDVKSDYDAERNFHYKLTLKFRGWANEADWHISYKEYIPTLLVYEPYYISFLYGQQLDFPARIKISEDMGDVRQYKLKAEIIENDWWPYDAETNSVPSNGPVDTSDEYGFNWFEAAYNKLYDPKTTDYNGFAGFLSLIDNDNRDVIGVLGEDREMSYADYWDNKTQKWGSGSFREYGPKANEWLSNYYETTDGLKEQIYPLDGSNEKVKTTYSDYDNTVDLQIPMYTRQAQIGTGSDFSGNNPFNNYSRLSKVKFTLLDPSGKEIDFKDADGNWIKQKICRIIQVPRIENPKAIYRSYDNSEPFDITLMYRKGANTFFEPYKSVGGPWRASIMCQNGSLIKLISKDGTKEVTEIARPESTHDYYIHGSTDDPIEFTYVPYGSPGKDGALCGVIKVEYNDYNCVHHIIVRKGYDAPVDFGGTKWSCYNVYATGKKPSNYSPQTNTTLGGKVNVALTRSPLSIGTFYKRMQYNYGYMESNNGASGLKWNETPSSTSEYTYVYLDGSSWNTGKCIWGPANSNGPQGYAWYNQPKTEDRWDIDKGYVWADTWTAVGSLQTGKEFTVPKAKDFNNLVKSAKFGFGVAYADGATATAELLDDAYGYTDYSNTGARSSKGVRVCVVYDEGDGRNFLFPLGATGSARRNRGKYGLLSYANQTGPFNNIYDMWRPLVYTLFRNAGATYWIKEAQTKMDGGKVVPDYATWDMNYFSIRFNPYDTATLWGATETSGWNANTSSDACPIKLIYK